MRKIICSVVMLSVGLLFLSAMNVQAAVPSVKELSQHTVFTKSIEDLPVMGGLEVVEDKDVFEVFGGQRIAQTVLRGPVDIDSVYYYYASLLPELGWRKLNAKTYQRDGERLFFRPSSANKDGMTYVRFDVEPILLQEEPATE